MELLSDWESTSHFVLLHAAIKKDIDHHHVLLESDGGSQSLIGPQHS